MLRRRGPHRQLAHPIHARVGGHRGDEVDAIAVAAGRVQEALAWPNSAWAERPSRGKNAIAARDLDPRAAQPRQGLADQPFDPRRWWPRRTTLHSRWARTRPDRAAWATRAPTPAARAPTRHRDRGESGRWRTGRCCWTRAHIRLRGDPRRPNATSSRRGPPARLGCTIKTVAPITTASPASMRTGASGGEGLVADPGAVGAAVVFDEEARGGHREHGVPARRQAISRRMRASLARPMGRRPVRRNGTVRNASGDMTSRVKPALRGKPGRRGALIDEGDLSLHGDPCTCRATDWDYLASDSAHRERAPARWHSMRKPAHRSS